MIIFDLQCINGHTFEGWFDDGKNFTLQQEQGQILCPVCGTTAVTQRLSPIALRTSQGSGARERARQEAAQDLAARVSNFVEKNFDNVGPNFAREALKIHYGGAEPKNIMGTTTAEEDKILEKEGIEVIKLPLPPESEENLN